MPAAFAQEALERDERQGNNQISAEEGKGTLGLLRVREFQQGEKGKQNDDRTSAYDLPLEMAAIRFMGAHARGRDSSENSLASRGSSVRARIQLATVQTMRTVVESAPAG